MSLEAKVKYRGTAFILFTAFLYLVLGLLFLINPEGMSSGLGYEALSNSALTEVMASYGGLWFGIGVVLLVLKRKGEARIALLLIFLTFAGFALGRSLGAIRYGGFYGLNSYWLASEIIYLAVTAHFLKYYRKQKKEEER